jgi:hypothetical protein
MTKLATTSNKWTLRRKPSSRYPCRLAKDQNDPGGALIECVVVNTFVRENQIVATVTLNLHSSPYLKMVPFTI